MTCDILLVPYHNIQYHLKEWYQCSCLGGAAPDNYKEPCHAQAPNIIEHIFGVIKHCFKLLINPPEYPIHMQAKSVVALCALFNFLCIWEPTNDELGKTIPDDEWNEIAHSQLQDQDFDV